MNQEEPPPEKWRTASYSDNGANCVQFAFWAGKVFIRDSKDPEGGWIALERGSAMGMIEALVN